MLPTPAKLLVATLLVAFLPAGALAQKKKQRPESKSGEAAAASESSAPKRPRVVVTAFEGPRAAKVRAWIVALLKEGDAELVQDKGLGKLEEDAQFVKAARKINASVFITGKVKQGKRWSLEVRVRDGASGSAIEKLSFEGTSFNRLKADVEGSFWTKAADPIHVARAPEAAGGLREGQAEDATKGEAEETDETAGEEDAEDPEQTEETDESERAGADAASEPARPGAGPEARPSPLQLLLAIRGFSRRFEFEDDLFGVMRRYELGAAPSVSLGVHWYPLAHSRGGLPAHLGVMAGYERGILISTVNDTADLETSTWAFFAGVRARLPLGAQELGVSATYGQHSFTIDGDEARPFPDVKYSYLRPALDASFRVERVSFGFHVGHRFLFSTGELGSELWFPRLDGAGFDAGVFVGQALGEAFEARAGVDLRRYYFAMHPVVGDRYVVGGGVDQYLSLWVGLHYRFPPSD